MAFAISFKIPLAYCVQIPIVSLETKLPMNEVRIKKNILLFKAVKKGTIASRKKLNYKRLRHFVQNF